MFGQYSCFHTFQCLTKAYGGINATQGNTHTTNVHTLSSACQRNIFVFYCSGFV